jgi:16S rRNA (adenine1518-N6/adenine1519-N6)-dimethyltransferase
MPRRLGQHFLRPASVERLLKLIDPRPDQTFLEIGSGRGALTLPLAERAQHVVAVELDRRLAAELQERARAAGFTPAERAGGLGGAPLAPPSSTRPAIPRLTVVAGDALRTDLASLVPRGSRLVGNLPYYVSSPLLRRFLELRSHVTDLHVMLQEEVARRVASPPGSREYGILSVLFAAWADVDLPLRFPPGAFVPAPKVSSALLRARFLPRPRVEIDDMAAFEQLVKTAFRQRRRTLENNLRDSYPNLKENLRLLNIEGSCRAETLSMVDFARLSRALRRAMPA